jgi:ADP-L-glycero-D-manno-heptose 6-epimerase
MNKKSKIIITGAKGFIGSCFLSFLNKMSYENIILVDNKKKDNTNIAGKKYIKCIDIFDLENNLPFIKPDYIFHFGAISDTSETNINKLEIYNLSYSKMLWNYCINNNTALIYASSAATYGNGEFEYEDSHDIIPKLKPLNLYGKSKNDFDKWCLEQDKQPIFWAGLKFFNVFGPNEYNKDNMSSIIFKGYNQIKNYNKLTLYKSASPLYKDGEQSRDFIYVKNLNIIVYWLITNLPLNGIYNIGSGVSSSFREIARNIFSIMGVKENIEYTEAPQNIINNYQYYTKANMSKLYSVGFNEKLYSVEEGIKDYIDNYLNNNSFL